MFPKSSHPKAGWISCVRWLGALASFLTAMSLMGAPVVTLQTAARQVLTPGSSTSLAVSATGSGGLAYQWIRNGWPVSGATSSSLALTNVAAADSGWYLCAVTDSAGTTRSKPIFVAVGPGLLWGPGDLENGVGYRTSLAPIADEVVSVAAGFHHALFLKADGSLWAVGGNGLGQLGNYSTENRSVPVLVATNVKSVVAAGSVSFFITNDDRLWGMGDNSGGQLGGGQYVGPLSSSPLPIANNVASVATSGNHTLFVKHDGTLWGMGWNGSGQLGNGSTSTQFSPVQIATGVSRVAVGTQFSLFVKQDESLWAMGGNEYGQLGDGTTESRLSPVQIATGVSKVAVGNFYSAYLKTDGTLWTMGLNTVGNLGDGTITNKSLPVQVSAGVTDVMLAPFGSTTLFLKSDHSLWGAGQNVAGQLGDGSTTNRNTPVTIATGVIAACNGANTTFFIKSDGSLWGTGLNDFGQLGDGSLVRRTTAINTGTKATAVFMGSGFTLAIDESGKLLTTGFNDVGQLGNGSVVTDLTLVASDVVAADIGSHSSLYVKSDGTLWRQPGGQVVGVSEVVAVSVGDYDLFRAYLKSDGSLWRLLDDDSSVQLAEDVVSVGAGLNYVAYLKGDGSLWGQETHVFDAAYIRFGDGSAAVQVASKVVSFSAAAWHMLYVQGDKTMWGQGTPWEYWYPTDVVWGAHAATPVQVDSDIIAAAAHHSHNIYTKTDGFVWSRGAGWRDSAGPAAVVVTGAPLAYASADRTFYLLPDGVLRSVKGVKQYLGVTETWAEGVVGVSCGTEVGDFVFLQATGFGEAPAINTHPASGSVTRGTALLLSVVANGGGRLDYQWFKDGAPLAGARGSQYQVSYADSADAGSYTVKLTNAAGSVISNAAVVTVKDRPAVTWAQPQSITYGTPLSGTQLNATSSVPGTFEYSPAAGATLYVGVQMLTATFTPTDTATYGSVTIQRSITVNQASQATAPSISSASSATFGANYVASATGAGFGYITWALGSGSTAAGAAINPNTGAISYTSTGTVVMKARFAGDYNHLPSDYSADFTVVINPAPATVTLGGLAASFDGAPKAVTATTNPVGLSVAITYGGSPTPPTLPGSYPVVATISSSNHAGSATGTLVITDNGPVVTGQSERRNVVSPGAGLTLSVAAAATGTPVYQWYHNGRIIAGAVGSSLLLSDATYGDNGAYWVTITNMAGQTRSAPFFLTVAPGQSQIRAWGGGFWGQTNVPNTLVNPVALSSNSEHTLALQRDGKVVAWGNNTWQQSNVPGGLANVVAVAAGGHFSLALKADGTVVGWGESDRGQYYYYDNPTNVVAIAAGFRHSLLLKIDGTVAAYGQNTFGQCDVPANLSGVVAVAAGARHSVALKSDGTVVVWGDQSSAPAEAANVASIVAMNYHTLALKADGTVVAWVAPFQYAVDAPVGLSGVQAIATGPFHLLAIKEDGSLVGWGGNTQGEATAPADFSTDIFAASGGSGFTVALRDASRDTAPSITLQPVGQSVTAGQAAQLSVTAQGFPAPTYQWRKNGTPIPGATGPVLSWSNLLPDDAGSYDVVVTNYLGSVSSDGAIVTVDVIQPTNGVTFGTTNFPTRPLWPNDTFSFSYVVINSGTKSWGPNHSFVLQDANGNTVASSIITLLNSPHDHQVQFDFTAPSVPGTYVYHLRGFESESGFFGDQSITFTVSPFNGAASVSAGYHRTAVVDAMGRLWMAGYLHVPSAAEIHSTPYFTADNVTQVADGYSHTLFAKQDGSLWFTGQEFDGYSLDPLAIHSLPVQKAADVAAIAVGSSNNYYIKNDGTLWAWGDNRYGQLGDGTRDYRAAPVQIASQVRSVAAGGINMCYVKADGTLWFAGATHILTPYGGSPSPDALAPVQVASGVREVYHSTFSNLFAYLKNDGTLWLVGSLELPGGGEAQPAPLQLASDVISASVSFTKVHFIKSDGTLWAWGGNPYGELGTGNVATQYSPVQIAANVNRVSTGSDHAVFARTDGSVWVMGSDERGQLGNGPTVTASQATPVMVASGTAVSTSAPTRLKVKVGDQGYVLLSWKASIGATGYEIWRSSTNDFNTAARIGATNGSTLFYDQRSDAGATYYYWVRALSVAGGGSLGTSVVLNTQSRSGDFNGDGKTDWLWQNMATGERSFWFMNGAAVAGGSSLGIVPVEWQIAATADFNGDRQSDLLWQNSVSGERVIWLMQDGGIIGSVSLGVLTVDWQIAACADFSGDGSPDIVWQHTVTGNRVIWTLSGTTVTGGGFIGNLSTEWSICTSADLNQDGQADLVMQNIATGQRAVWIMNGMTVLESVSLGTGSLDWSICGAGDLNADGQDDLYLQNALTGERTVWYMNGTTKSSEQVVTTLGTDWALFIPPLIRRTYADFDANGKTDLVWQNSTTKAVKLWLLDGTTLSSELSLFTPGANERLAGSGDFDGNSETDLVIHNQATGEVTIRFYDGVTFLQATSAGTRPLAWQIACTGDFNRDGRADLVWQNTSTGAREIWLMNGATHVSTADLSTVALDWQIAASGDFDSDGRSDLVWQNTVSGERLIWFMSGTVVRAAQTIATVPLGWKIVGTGDFNGDTKTDLIWQNSDSGDRLVWIMVGTLVGGGLSLGNQPLVWDIRN